MGARDEGDGDAAQRFPDRLSLPCPACDEEVTIARWVLAPTPWHLRCAGCGTGLKPARGFAALVGVGAVTVLAAAVPIALLHVAGKLGWVGVVVMAAVAGLCFDLVSGYFVFSRGALAPRGPAPSGDAVDGDASAPDGPGTPPRGGGSS